MFEFLSNISPLLNAFFAGLFCWLCTSVGALAVFFFKNLKSGFMTSLLSFAGGVMIASAFFSLLLPALDYCENSPLKKFGLVITGFILGGVLIVVFNKIYEKSMKRLVNVKSVNPTKQRNFLLVFSITLHNIPEGMAIGVAFGALIGNFSTTYFITAVMLAVGIGIQNIPEGASVSFPLKQSGVKNGKAFLVGVLSGVVEPIAAIIACALSVLVVPILPLFLAFSAGTMLVVACGELVFEAAQSNKNQAIIFLVLGFALMATLDILLS